MKRIVVVGLLAVTSIGCPATVRVGAGVSASPVVSNDWKLSIEKLAQTVEGGPCRFQQGGSSSGSGSGGSSFNADKTEMGTLTGPADALDRVVRLLKGDIERAVQINGMAVVNATETVTDGKMSSFRFEYGVGLVNGLVDCTATPQQDGSRALTLKITEHSP